MQSLATAVAGALVGSGWLSHDAQTSGLLTAFMLSSYAGYMVDITLYPDPNPDHSLPRPQATYHRTLDVVWGVGPCPALAPHGQDQAPAVHRPYPLTYILLTYTMGIVCAECPLS